MSNTMTGAALLSGYVLGRTKKAKVAIAVASWVLRKKIDPKKVTSQITGSPALSTLRDQMREELLTAGKEAAASAVAARADRLADTLHQRTLSLRQEVPGAAGDQETEPREEREGNGDEEPEPRDEREENGDKEPEPRDEREENGDKRPERRPARPAAKRQRAQARSEKAVIAAAHPVTRGAGAGSDGPRRSSADRGRRSEDESDRETGRTRMKRRSEG
ncbi:hypothetical protein [Streptomyces sp. NRRL S-118]|uniref:hypothetical protein n=1 Tax=Streptomyces sp. NRRL S-118 TaxID=1463881 RepID=UPI00069385F1|nr:hypothetical protein [Streptomyces sp. NRRL S-118]